MMLSLQKSSLERTYISSVVGSFKNEWIWSYETLELDN